MNDQTSIFAIVPAQVSVLVAQLPAVPMTSLRNGFAAVLAVRMVIRLRAQRAQSEKTCIMWTSLDYFRNSFCLDKKRFVVAGLVFREEGAYNIMCVMQNHRY